TPVQGPLWLNVCPSILIRTRIRTVPRQRRQNSTMELDEPYHEALDAQQNNEGQSQQANQTLPGANIEITTLQMMQQMMKQISELTARIAKIEITSTPTPAEPTPTPAVDATPPPAIPAPPHEPKGLKDPDAFDGTRSQYLPWKYQIKAKLRSEPRRFHTSQLAIDYTFSRTTGDARARVFPWVSIHAASSTLDEFFRHLDEAFKDPHMAETARNKLQNMRQKTHNVRDFMQDFNKEALTAGLFDHAILKSMFLNALNHELRTALAGTIFPESTTIEEMQSHIAAVSDNLWRLKLSNKRRDAPQHTTTPSFTSSPEPMDWEPSRSQAQRAKW
ncbi:Gag, partial [Pyrenophora tritici-repentis]